MFKPDKKNNGNVYVGIVGNILLYVLCYCVLTVVFYPYGVSVAVTTAAAMALTINSVRRRDKKKRNYNIKQSLGISFVKLSKREVLVLMLLGVGLNFLIGGILNILPSGISSGYTESYQVIMGGNIYGTVIVIAIVTPVLEEIFFRGIFQRQLNEKLGEVKGLIAATCIFGLMHFNLVWSLYTAVIGFFLGCIYLYYKSVFPGAIVHCFFNLVSCIPLLVSRYEVIYRYTFGSKVYVVITLILGLAIIYYIVDKTWIKMFFDMDFYRKKALNEVDSDEVDVGENN